jgi:hypothetical protein
MNIESVSVKCESGEPYTFYILLNQLHSLSLPLSLSISLLIAKQVNCKRICSILKS